MFQVQMQDQEAVSCGCWLIKGAFFLPVLWGPYDTCNFYVCRTFKIAIRVSIMFTLRISQQAGDFGGEDFKI